MSGKRPSKPVEVPAFSSDRLKLMAPFLTAHVIELAQRRVFEPGFTIACRKRGTNGKEQITYADGTPTELKSALVLAKVMHPAELFNGEEDAMYRGASRKTVGEMKARGELSED